MRYLMHQPSRQSPRWRRFARQVKAPVTELNAARRAALAELARANARRNDTVALVRSLTTPARKRGGARYGPAPTRPTNERMQAPKPMRSMLREQVYLTDHRRGYLTARQHRQYCRMALLHGDGNVARSPWGKGRATPKRKASR